MSERDEVSFRTLEGRSLTASMRNSALTDRAEVVLADLHGVEVAAIRLSQLACADRFLQIPDPARPGRHLEIGPIDVARLKALPTTHLYARPRTQHAV
jgi:hypothetical protein